MEIGWQRVRFDVPARELDMVGSWEVACWLFMTLLAVDASISGRVDD
jgi:hypothetical protein